MSFFLKSIFWGSLYIMKILIDSINFGLIESMIYMIPIEKLHIYTGKTAALYALYIASDLEASAEKSECFLNKLLYK